MRVLYRARLKDHVDTVDAEYAAMRQTLASRRRAGMSTQPYYWAGFVAAGDWR
jgi:CHAT domain-containing protein